MARHAWLTVPQFYVGDEFIGGSTDSFDVGKAGGPSGRLDAPGIPWSDNIRHHSCG